MMLHRLLCTLAIGLSVPLGASAASEEIQVYLDNLSAPGEFGVDVHNNFALKATQLPEYTGQQPPHRVYRMTPELYYGVTKTLELGLYLLSSRGPGESAQFDGSKLRLKYIAPHDELASVFWGVNLEVGRSSQRASETAWNGQLKGILGWRGSGWTLGVNSNLDWSISKGGGPAQASLDLKAARVVSEGTQLGLELYSDLGPLRRPDALNRNAKTLYLAVDQNLGRDVDLNMGIGRGLTSYGDRWVLKFIVGTHF